MTDPRGSLPSSDIAIIGLAAHLPGAPDVETFWANLCDGVESVRPISREVLRGAGVSDAVLSRPDYVAAGTQLPNTDCFDAAFFGVSPKDAAIMDPQHRHFLECAWEALEHAGYAATACPGPVAVFAGSGPNSYLFYNVLSDPALIERDGIFALRHTGNDKDILATRVSFQMNLRGPSVNVQTACSTSLSAVHFACQSLLNHECELALTGAVTIEFPQAIGYLYREGEILSRDGHCRAFDADASGTVYGSGAAVVVLRRLADAIAARDTIHAVIKGTAINNDGSRKVGFFSPSVEGQVDVIAEALAVAGVAPESVGYVEAHGTGTAIGDPIELSALGQVYGVPERDAPLWVGSVKPNIGHLDTAAGMAGLIKAALAVKAGRIPPTLHFRRPNPRVDFGRLGVQVSGRLIEWSVRHGAPRRAAVTSLGIGGTNAHVVLEQPPAPMADQETRGGHSGREWQILALSAKSAVSLDHASDRMARFLARDDAPDLGDVAYTSQIARVPFPLRSAVVCRTRADAISALQGGNPRHVVRGETDRALGVAFLCTGQGSQYVGMAEQLYDREPVFRQWLDRIAEMARPHIGVDLRTIVYPTLDRASDAAREIRETWYTQPILFAIEYAVAQQWIAWGVKPEAVIGHSIGEYVAAALAGVFTLEGAVAIVCARGNLMRGVDRGSMLAVARPLDEFESLVPDALGPALSLAAINAPDQCVLAGPTPDIERVERQLGDAGIPTHRLATSHAFHSSSMDPILDQFRGVVAAHVRHRPTIPVISNVTGTWLSDQEAVDPDYWVRHVRQAVRFSDGVGTLLARRHFLLLEVGPGDTLVGLARQHPARTASQRVVASLPRASAAETETETVTTALATLWAEGKEIDWGSYHADAPRRRVPIPTYAFERQHHWLGPRNASTFFERDQTAIDRWFQAPVWEQTAPRPLTPLTGSWLVVGDGAGTGAELTSKLRERGVPVVHVRAGHQFVRRDPQCFEMEIANDAHWQTLVGELGPGGFPTMVVHLCALDDDGLAEDRCFFSLAALVRALRAKDADAPLEVAAISAGSVRVRDELVTDPDGALVDGVVHVAPKEYPSTSCRHIDVDVVDPHGLSTLLLTELASSSREQAIAYRDGLRWTRRVRQAVRNPVALRLRDGGVYLITGGLGELGMACADWLARTRAARLVLVSRDAIRRAQDQRLQLDEWERLGAQVLVCEADVTDPSAMALAVAAARERFGQINGVMHAAGTLADGLIALKTREQAAAVLAPKVAGWRVLEALLRDEPLDFTLLFSSVSAIAPPAGQVDYCAANAYLIAAADSVPTARSVTAVGWGAWGEIGMAARGATGQRERGWRHPFFPDCRIESDTARIYAGTFSADRHWILSEHRVRGGDALLPGTTHLDLAVSAMRHTLGGEAVELTDVGFFAPCVVRPNQTRTLVCRLERVGAGYRFTVADDNAIYASGVAAPAGHAESRLDVEALRRRCATRLQSAPRNIRQESHIDFGPRWRSVREIALGQGECLATLQLDREFQHEVDDLALHPALLDMATGVALWLVPGADRPGDVMLPFAYRRIRAYRRLPAAVVTHARLRTRIDGDVVTFDATIATPAGEVIAEVEGLSVKRLKNPGDAMPREASVTPPGSSAAEARALDRKQSSMSRDRIATPEGIEALRRILAARTTDVVFVSPVDLESPAKLASNESVHPDAQRATNGAGLPVAARRHHRGAGGSETEEGLRVIWQRLLGVDEVDSTSDFFHVGGHSLHALRLFAEIRKVFGVDLGVSTVFEARTLGAQASLIDAARGVSTGDPDPAPQRIWPRGIVPIRGEGTLAPLFLIHDVGGMLLGYTDLARHLDNDLPVFGIEAKGFSGSMPEHDLEKMATEYIALLRAVRPAGPYHLAGHSFGGLVAYEMARQLKAAGEAPGLVGVIDTYRRGVPDRHSPTAGSDGFLPLHRRLGHHARTLLLGPDRRGYVRGRLLHWVDRTTQLAYRTAHSVALRSRMQLPRVLWNVEQANWLATRNYQHHRYEDTVTLFRCSAQSEWDTPDPLMGWGEVAAHVEVRVVPGDHLTMMKDPNVHTLAHELSRMFRQSEIPQDDVPREPVAVDEHSRYQRA